MSPPAGSKATSVTGELSTGLVSLELAVSQRYASASQQAEAALCCPVSYRPEFLAAIPAEVLERDYGCGDPSRHVQPGDVVLDLGSGGGKICFIAAQVAGEQGRVIGVDMTDDMLRLARGAAPRVADAIGYANVEFRKGRIQDLALDLERFETYLAEHPVQSVDDWRRAEAQAESLRQTDPLVCDDSIDCAVSNCVLNLVRDDDRQRLFAELFRVLKPGGRAVISDITSDRPVPATLRADPELWSGCISGAYEERQFLAAFVDAGFVGVEIIERQSEPWMAVEGIEFRSLTVRAYKPLAPADAHDEPLDVVYRGPWLVVVDDAGRQFERGERVAVESNELTRLQTDAYASQFLVLRGNEELRRDRCSGDAAGHHHGCC